MGVMRERKIGEVFYFDNVKLKVMKGEGTEEYDCERCHFKGKDICKYKDEREYIDMFCGITRKDGKQVYYKEDKEMNKLVFENEEEMQQIIDELSIHKKIYANEIDYTIRIGDAFIKAKQKGYLKQSPLEEAREIYKHLEKTQSNSGTPIHPDIVDYVNLLEEALKKKEGKS